MIVNHREDIDALLARQNIGKEAIDRLISVGISGGERDTEEFRESVKKSLLNNALILGHVKKSGFAFQPEIQHLLKSIIETTLVEAYVDIFFKEAPVDDGEIRKAYEALKSRLGANEHLLSIITVGSEADALEILAKLNEGGNFETLAARFSTDESKGSGGDIGWIAEGALSDPARNAIKSLGESRFTVPIQGENECHILYIRGTRATIMPQIDKIRAQLVEMVRAQKFEHQLRELQQTA
ncbi:peptidylprolyl isomerase [Burkholderia sp. AW33-5]